MGDWNSRKQDVGKWFEQLHMLDAIMEQHKEEPPVTYKRSGKDPLDGIYTTSTVVGVGGTFFAFHKLGEDHRGLLLDIPAEMILGFHIHHLVPPKARKLQVDNPTIVNKYNI